MKLSCQSFEIIIAVSMPNLTNVRVWEMHLNSMYYQTNHRACTVLKLSPERPPMPPTSQREGIMSKRMFCRLILFHLLRSYVGANRCAGPICNEMVDCLIFCCMQSDYFVKTGFASHRIWWDWMHISKYKAPCALRQPDCINLLQVETDFFAMNAYGVQSYIGLVWVQTLHMHETLVIQPVIMICIWQASAYETSR